MIILSITIAIAIIAILIAVKEMRSLQKAKNSLAEMQSRQGDAEISRNQTVAALRMVKSLLEVLPGGDPEKSQSK